MHLSPLEEALQECGWKTRGWTNSSIRSAARGGLDIGWPSHGRRPSPAPRHLPGARPSGRLMAPVTTNARGGRPARIPMPSSMRSRWIAQWGGRNPLSEAGVASPTESRAGGRHSAANLLARSVLLGGTYCGHDRWSWRIGGLHRSMIEVCLARGGDGENRAGEAVGSRSGGEKLSSASLGCPPHRIEGPAACIRQQTF
jgi:hypothetical protein